LGGLVFSCLGPGDRLIPRAGGPWGGPGPLGTGEPWKGGGGECSLQVKRNRSQI